MNIFIFPRSKSEDLDIGIFELDQAKALKKAGNNVVLIYYYRKLVPRYNNKPQDGHKFIEHKIFDGVDYYCLYFTKYLTKLSGSFRNFLEGLILPYYIRYIEKISFKPDVIHCHFHFITRFWVSYLKKYCKKFNSTCKLVCTLHDPSIIVNIYPGWYKVKDLDFLDEFDKTFVVSKSFSDDIKKRYNKTTNIVTNVVDSNQFTFVKRENNSQQFYFIMPCVDFVKRPYLLLDSFKEANFEDNVFLRIVCRGDRFSTLEKISNYIDKNEIKNVIIYPFLSRERLKLLFEKSHVCILTSLYETFCLSLCEAMLTGMPVITTYSGGPNEFIRPFNGMFVDDDKAKIAKAMHNIKDNYNKYNQKMISQYIYEAFNPNELSNKIINAYNS